MKNFILIALILVSACRRVDDKKTARQCINFWELENKDIKQMPLKTALRCCNHLYYETDRIDCLGVIVSYNRNIVNGK